MGNLKTPKIKQLRSQGGTFFSFASAIEDIGLNIAERNNKVRLSHYAILNIPKCDEYEDDLNNEIVNKFNIFTCPGAMGYRYTSDSSGTDVAYNNMMIPNNAVAQSFMSYALNMETALINASSYDYSASLTVSERVFWKWLKETGAIRWYKNDKNLLQEGDGPTMENNTDNTKKYENVVKAIGKIDGVSQRSSEYGMYNEVYVNIPSSFGTTTPIYFKQISDRNYSFGQILKSSTLNLIGYNAEEQISDTSLYNIGFYDYSVKANDVSNNFTLDAQSNKIWCDDIAREHVDNVYSNLYIINNDISNDEDALINNKISVSIDVNDNKNINYSILRSNYDCMSLDILLDNYDAEATYDTLSMKSDSENYDFNTILVYYSVYDNNDNILATNLYGVYFINSVNNLITDNTDKSLSFEIPYLSKIKSTSNGFGTSYAFRLNMRTKTIYDDTLADINDNSASENSIVSDFNDVVANLNKSIELLGRHTKHTHILTEKYNRVENSINNIHNDLISVRNDVNRLLTNNQDEINASFISTNSLNVDNLLINPNKNGDSFDIQYKNDKDEVKNIIKINESNVNFETEVNINNSILYNNDIFTESSIEELELPENLNNYFIIVPKSSDDENNMNDLLDIQINPACLNYNTFGIKDNKIDLITILAYILKKIDN